MEHLRQLRQFRDMATGGDRFRPWLPLWLIVDSVIESLFAAAHAYLAALGATTPAEAQRLAVAAQASIDAAGVTAEEAARLVGAYARLAEAATEEEAVAVLADRAAARAGAATILDLEAYGNDVYGRAVGQDEHLPVGLGLLAASVDAQGSAFLDIERLWSCARTANDVIRAGDDHFRSFATDETVVEDVREASLFLFEASRTMHVMAQAARLERHEVEALLGFGHALIEGPIRRYLAVMAGLIKRRPYARFRGKDASDLLALVSQAGLGTLTDGLPKAVRHAVAHKDYRIEETDQGTEVILQRGSASKRRTAAELADDVLLALETALALQIAICAAVASARGSADDLEVDLGFTPATQVSMVMSFAGWADVTTTIEGCEALIEARCALTPQSIREAGTAATQLPASVERLTVRGTDASGRTSEFVAPLAPMRAFSTSDRLAKEAWFIETAYRSTLDGNAVMGIAHVRKWLAHQAAEVINGAEPDRTRRLKSLLKLAQRLEDSEAAKAIRDVMAIARANSAGLPANEDEREGLDRLTGWLRLELPDPFDA